MFKVSECNFSSPFLLSKHQNIALVESNVLETLRERVRVETGILRNGGKEAEMRKR